VTATHLPDYEDSPVRKGQLGPKTRQTLLALLLYLGLACFITWPIPIHPTSTLDGTVGADLTAEIAYYHAIVESHTAPFIPGTVHAFNAPEGRPTQWALNFSNLPSSLLLWLGSLTLGSILTFGLWPILTFTVSALAMFLFIRWVTGNWQPALIAGLAFGFWPFVFVGRNQPLGDTWVVVLPAWRMLVAIERPTLRNGLLAGVATAFALIWVQYFLIIVGVAWVVLAVSALAVGWLRGQLGAGIRAQAAGAVPVVLTLAAVLAAGIASNFAGAPVRPQSDLVQFSARPAMYLLPDPSNPFLGSLSKPIIDKDYYSATSTVTYDNIYVGISVLILASIGLWLLVRRIRGMGLRRAMADRRVLAAMLFTLCAFVALLFSAPPEVSIAGFQVPMPMTFVGQITTIFRTTARFALFVMLGLCVLAGFALSELLPRLKRNPRVMVVAAIAIIVTCDLWAEGAGASRFSVPSIFRVLAHQPSGVYVEYPLQDGVTFAGASRPAFYQAYAGKHDLFNGFLPGTDSETRKLELQYLLAPRTVPALAEFGVRYLLVDTLGQSVAPPMYARPRQPIPGTQLISSDAYGSLYRITARPQPLASFATSGFSSPEGRGPEYWRWMTASAGKMEVLSTSPGPVHAEVKLSVVSFARPRHLTITDGVGPPLYSAVIPYRPTRVHFGLTITRRAVLHFSVTPGPQSPHALDGANPDTRLLSIEVLEPLTIRVQR
jgi:hypothetical protein